MINILGTKKVLVDSDALIGLVHQDDSLHTKARKTLEYLTKEAFDIIIPYPIVLESATTLARKLKRIDLSKKLLNRYSKIGEDISYETVKLRVAALYEDETSKQNTPFDYYLLATASINNIKIIFSFDDFYKSHGLTLAMDL